MSAALINALSKPLANSYWVQPGKLLAGEHPVVSSAEESAVRLQDLLLAGINCFIDLTGIDELTPYAARLPARFAGRQVTYHRFAIVDHDVPDIQLMQQILDVIDAQLAAESCIYVHCRAGIGRTGTVIGCHLIRHGCAADKAVAALNVLWQSCARATSWSSIPETSAQQAFIRNFVNADGALVSPAVGAVSPAQRHLYQGALLGLAIGEILGAMRAPGSNDDIATQAALNNLAGQRWGSHVAMTFALSDGLLERRQADPKDQMQRYLAWQKQGKYSSDGAPPVVPSLVSKALGLWQWKRNALAGSHDPAILDAHSLPRCTAMALYFAAAPMSALREAAESSRTTIQSPLVLGACQVFTALLLAINEGLPVAKLVQFHEGQAFTALRALPLKPEIKDLIDGGWRTAMTHAAGDDVLSILASAIHAFATTQSFQAAVFKSMQNALRPDTVGAVCGALAGAWYGVQGLPIVWRETLPKADELMMVAQRLLNEAPR